MATPGTVKSLLHARVGLQPCSNRLISCSRNIHKNIIVDGWDGGYLVTSSFPQFVNFCLDSLPVGLLQKFIALRGHSGWTSSLPTPPVFSSIPHVPLQTKFRSLPNQCFTAFLSLDEFHSSHSLNDKSSKAPYFYTSYLALNICQIFLVQHNLSEVIGTLSISCQLALCVRHYGVRHCGIRHFEGLDIVGCILAAKASRIMQMTASSTSKRTESAK